MNRFGLTLDEPWSFSSISRFFLVFKALYAVNFHFRYLADFAPADRPQVPGIIVHCVKEVEARGLGEAGLYRVPGSEVVVKDLLHRFLKGKGMPNLARIDDINVICSLLKHFLRQLR